VIALSISSNLAIDNLLLYECNIKEEHTRKSSRSRKHPRKHCEPEGDIKILIYV